MNSSSLSQTQTVALAAISALVGHLGWNGDQEVVEGILVYQVPMPTDPDVSGAFFAVDPDELNIQLFLTLPLTLPEARRSDAREFVIRSSYGLRFGALEFDLVHGSLRVRMDTDATEETVTDAVVRLFDRAMALARKVSPGWKALCRGEQQGGGIAAG